MLIEQNVISLRTAIILEEQGLVYFELIPEWVDTAVPKTIDYTKWESTWLYRRKRSFFMELVLNSSRYDIQRDIRAVTFKVPPKFKLLWNDSGRSVAVLINGEPWAFIHEARHCGYSKGILRPTLGNLWDQELFEKTFNGWTAQPVNL